MRHSYLDEYYKGNSLIHGLDPRVKVIFTFAFILILISTKATSFSAFLFYLLFLTFLIYLSKIPFTFFIKRSLLLLPFILLILISLPFLESKGVGSYNLGGIEVSKKGLLILWNCLIKAFLCINLLSLLISTTGFNNLLKGLESLRLPNILIQVLSFMYRYIFLIIDEMHRMYRAKEVRSIKVKGKYEFKALSSIIGTLFLRSYERAERVYLAMLARGFDGKIKTLRGFKIRLGDISFLCSSLAYIIIVKLMLD